MKTDLKIITLLTDFGSFYPAQMKGVILGKVNDATIVDITHDIPPRISGQGPLLSFPR